VVAADIDEAKQSRALALGADEAVPPDALERPVRAVLDFVGSNESIALAARIVDRSGTIVLIGEAGGRLDYHFRALPFETSLTTSVWGSRNDLAAVLKLASRGKLRWDVETLPLELANEAIDRLRRGEVTGRLVLVP
jgi:propanol-preferring alcohol dehydrogenase